MLYTHSTHTLLLSLRQLRGPDGSSLSFPTARSTCSNKRRLGILSHRRYPTPSSWVWEENTDAVRVVSALQLVLRSYRNTKLQQGERAAGPPLPCRAVAQCRLCTVSDPLPRQCPHALVCPLVHAGASKTKEQGAKSKEHTKQGAKGNQHWKQGALTEKSIGSKQHSKQRAFRHSFSAHRRLHTWPGRHTNRHKKRDQKQKSSWEGHAPRRRSVKLAGAAWGCAAAQDRDTGRPSCQSPGPMALLLLKVTARGVAAAEGFAQPQRLHTRVAFTPRCACSHRAGRVHSVLCVSTPRCVCPHRAEARVRATLRQRHTIRVAGACPHPAQLAHATGTVRRSHVTAAATPPPPAASPAHPVDGSLRVVRPAAQAAAARLCKEAVAASDQSLRQQELN
eukprot:357111-Chlamydomonas_euryale.AAC.6